VPHCEVVEAVRYMVHEWRQRYVNDAEKADQELARRRLSEVAQERVKVAEATSTPFPAPFSGMSDCAASRESCPCQAHELARELAQAARSKRAAVCLEAHLAVRSLRWPAWHASRGARSSGSDGSPHTPYVQTRDP